jgi:hypothetical protein
MLRRSRINPKLSAYAVLEGNWNFNKTPLAPIGTKALVFLPPKNRKSFQTHALDAFYTGPAKMHYRSYKFFIPETHGYRIASTAKFFPAHCKMPAIEPDDTVRLAAQDLIKALNTNSKAPLNLEPKHTELLRQLADIFQEAIPKEGNANDSPPPRVYTPSTSHDATAPRVVAKQPRIHQRITDRNKPIIEPVIEEEEEEALFEEVKQVEETIQPVVPPTRPINPSQNIKKRDSPQKNPMKH